MKGGFRQPLVFNLCQFNKKTGKSIFQRSHIVESEIFLYYKAILLN